MNAMPLTCNIDAKGKRVRFITGLATIGFALALAALWAWPTRDWVRWGAVGLLVLMGSFTLFEARAGWCVVRAMGFKTKI